MTFRYARVHGEWKVVASHSTLIVVEPAVPKDATARSEIVAARKGDKTHVVVVPSDGDDDATIVSYYEAWKAAGTTHILNLDPGHPERAADLFRLADVIEFSGDGPHSAINDPQIASALRAAHRAGKRVLPGASEPAVRAVLDAE